MFFMNREEKKKRRILRKINKYFTNKPKFKKILFATKLKNKSPCARNLFISLYKG